MDSSSDPGTMVVFCVMGLAFLRDSVVSIIKERENRLRALRHPTVRTRRGRSEGRKEGQMIRPIMRSQTFLARPARMAVPEDRAIGQNLLETLAFHRGECVGMAANMIGEDKAVIAIDDAGRLRVLYNPEIISRAAPYQVQEGCLSLEGMRPVRRFKRIKVRYQDDGFATRTETFTGFTAQIVQHEVDHCNGVII